MSRKLPSCIKVVNQANGPAKIHIRGVIGSKFDAKNWTMTNTEETVLNELNGIESGKKIDVHVNSKGGDVGLALGIYNALRRRAGDITTHNDGYACSSASVLMLGGDTIVSPDSSVWMIHRASAGTYGNADDKRKDAEMLEAHDKVIASIYAKQTGKSEKEMLDMMSKETWMTGKEARDMGLADEDGEIEPDEDDVEDSDSEREVIATFRNIPENLRARLVTNSAENGGKPAVPPRQQTADKPKMKKIIEALAAKGIKLPENATEDDILAAWNKVQASLESENQKHKEAQKKRVEARVQKAVDEKRIKAERKDAWVARGLADESSLDELDEIPMPKAEDPKAKRTPAGAAPIEDDASGDDLDENDREIEKVQKEIAALYKSTNNNGSRLEQVSPKIGALTRRLQKLRGDEPAKIQWVKN